MKSRHSFLLGIAFGLFLSCIIHLMNDSTIGFDSAMTIVLGIVILLIVILLDHCDKHQN